MLKLLLFALLLSTPLLAHPADDAGPLYFSVDPTGSALIETHDGFRFITSTGIPTHPTGQFPNPHNPNSISPQNYTFRIPLSPKPNDQPIPLVGHTLFGVALNGVPFDPGTAEFFHNDPSTGWRMEAIGGPRNLGLDPSNAHVQPNGAYHYHGLPTALISQLLSDSPKAHGPRSVGLPTTTKPLLLGYAADGYPIYNNLGYSDPANPKSPLKNLTPSYQLKQGPRPPNSPPGKYDGSYTRDWEFSPHSGDLDESNGRTGPTPEFPAGTYYYVLTHTFPFIPRSFHATPDPSFNKKGPPPGNHPRNAPPPP